MSTSEITVEPWVDAEAVAAHLGFKSDYVRKQAAAGKIPGTCFQNGKRAYWRFKISAVDQNMAAPSVSPVVNIDINARRA